MRFRWMVAVALSACNVSPAVKADAPNFYPRENTGIAAAATFPPCLVVEVGAPFDVTATSAEAAELLVQTDAPSIVLSRQSLSAGEHVVSVTTTDLSAGSYPVRLALFAAGRIAFEQSATLVVAAAIDGAATSDQDLDCFSPRLGDCNDNSPSIHPAAPEVCGDDADNDCQGGDEPCP